MEISPLTMRVAMIVHVDLYDLVGVPDERLATALGVYETTMAAALRVYNDAAEPHNARYWEAYRLWQAEWQARRAAGEDITLTGQGSTGFWHQEPAHPHDRIVKAKEQALAPYRAALQTTRDAARAALLATCHASREGR